MSVIGGRGTVHTPVSPLRAVFVAAVLIAAGLVAGCGGGGTLAPSPPTTLLPSSNGSPSTSGSPSPTGSPRTLSPSPVPNATYTPGQPVSDNTIKTYLIEKFGQDPLLLHLKIRVAVHNGDVFLYGTVSTNGQKHAAEQWAITAPGVKEVVSYIVVNPNQGGGGGGGPY
jgi:hypothetical protein